MDALSIGNQGAIIANEIAPAVQKAVKTAMRNTPRQQSNNRTTFARMPVSETTTVAKVKEIGRSMKLSSHLAKAVILPMISAERYSAGWTCEPTVLGRPFTIQSVDVVETMPDVVGVTTGETWKPYFQGGSYMVGITRDPLNAIIEYVPTPSSLAWGYQVYFSNAVDASHEADTPQIQVTTPVLTAALPAPMVYKTDLYPSNTTVAHPFGAVSFARAARENAALRFFWLDRGTKLIANFWTNENATGANNFTGTVALMRWDGIAAVPAINFAITSAPSWNYIIRDSGNYGLWVGGSGSGAVYMSLVHEQGEAPPSVLSHRPIPGMFDRSTLTGVRVVGASVMITPDAAELAKGGWSVGIQLDDAYQAEAMFTNASSKLATDTIATLRGAHSMGFHKGMYGWHKPHTEASFAMQTPYRFNVDYASQAPDSEITMAKKVATFVSYMDPPDGVLLLACNTPPNITGGSSSFPGGLLHTTFSWSVEYTSNDVWLSPRSVVPHSSDFNQLMSHLVRAPQFTENSMHVRDLLRWLRGQMREFGQEMGLFVNHMGPHLRKILDSGLAFGSATADGLSSL